MLLFIIFSLLFLVISVVFLTFLSKAKSKLFKFCHGIYATIFFVASIAMLTLFFLANKQFILNQTVNALSNAKAVSTISAEKYTSSLRIDDESNIPKDEVYLEAPLILQLPELPRGCEVTSLGMLLSFHGIDVQKEKLAKEVQKNPAEYKRRNGKIHFGSPYNGFVGDMYSFDTPGLGVYHGPIADLAKKYAPNKEIVDLTGEDFAAVKEQLGMGRPVWVIINSHYKQLPDSEFITWHTEDGPLEITYRQHSVLITGYDDDYVYFNDPLNYHDKADIKNFEEAWIQMGRQAITIF